jgi:hypothetical protein
VKGQRLVRTEETMVNGMSKAVGLGWRRAGRAVLLCALMGATVSSLGAQTPGETTVTVLKSGLHSIFGGHAFLLTVAEVGSTASSSEVKIEFRDASDQRRAMNSGVLHRGRPVRLRVPVPAGTGREQLRVIVTITTLANGEGSEPIVGLEDLDADSLVVETKPPCAPPPSVGGGAEGNCDGGWRVNRLTLGKAGGAGDE